MHETQAQREARHARVLAFASDINTQLDAIVGAVRNDQGVPALEETSFGTLMTWTYDQANQLKDALQEVLFKGSPDMREVINCAAALASFTFLIAEKIRPSLTPTQD